MRNQMLASSLDECESWRRLTARSQPVLPPTLRQPDGPAGLPVLSRLRVAPRLSRLIPASNLPNPPLRRGKPAGPTRPREHASYDESSMVWVTLVGRLPRSCQAGILPIETRSFVSVLRMRNSKRQMSAANRLLPGRDFAAHEVSRRREGEGWPWKKAETYKIPTTPEKTNLRIRERLRFPVAVHGARSQ